MLCYAMLCYDMILYDVIWYNMIWYNMMWYDIIWYSMIWYNCRNQIKLNHITTHQILCNESNTGFHILRPWYPHFFLTQEAVRPQTHHITSNHITDKKQNVQEPFDHPTVTIITGCTCNIVHTISLMHSIIIFTLGRKNSPCTVRAACTCRGHMYVLYVVRLI